MSYKLVDVKNLAVYWDTDRLEEWEGEELMVRANWKGEGLMGGA